MSQTIQGYTHAVGSVLKTIKRKKKKQQQDHEAGCSVGGSTDWFAGRSVSWSAGCSMAWKVEAYVFMPVVEGPVVFPGVPIGSS